MAAPLPAERGGGISLFRDFYASPSRASSYRGLREKTPRIYSVESSLFFNLLSARVTCQSSSPVTSCCGEVGEVIPVPASAISPSHKLDELQS